jgi:radical SAM superfamily enzyme YgiQ (UPF0313 family)|tara:strand:- start:73 stop:1599 length:1527 start_codon:yes stop_codon:yes gene_type:complete
MSKIKELPMQYTRDILLVHVNSSLLAYQELNTISQIEPPIWASMIAKNLISNGYNVNILDAEVEGLTAKETVLKIDEYKPKLVCFVVYGQHPSASSQNMAGVHLCLEELKNNFPFYKTLLVGLYPSALSRKTLEDESCDFVCQGEGPYTIIGLLESNMNDISHLRKIPGLWYRDDNNEIVYNHSAQLIPQGKLETKLPGMAWDLLDMKKYRTANWHSMTNNNESQPFAALYTSLGCPYKCTFCSINAPFGNNNVENSYGRPIFRYWDPEFIITEFDKIADMGIRNIKIADEMFVLNKNHFLKICDLIIDRGYDFNIWAYARVDTVREEYLERLRAAGFNWLALGIESGNRKVRMGAAKGKFEEVDVKNIVKKIQSYDINVVGNFIFGLEGDDYNTMNETYNLAKDLKCEWSSFYSALPHPGSQLYLDTNKSELPQTYTAYSQHSYDCTPTSTEYLTSSQILEFRDKSFYSIYKDDEYRKFLEMKFGKNSIIELDKVLSVKLKRKLLGD